MTDRPAPSARPRPRRRGLRAIAWLMVPLVALAGGGFAAYSSERGRSVADQLLAGQLSAGQLFAEWRRTPSATPAPTNLGATPGATPTESTAPTETATPTATAPTETTAPTPLTSPTAPALPSEATALAPDQAAISAALTPRLRAGALGRHVVAAVAPLRVAALQGAPLQGASPEATASPAAGDPVFVSGQGSFVPASTMKLLTAAAALEALGPEHVFTTRVVGSATPTQGVDRITLVGGGDPYLSSRPTPAGTYPPRADLRALARDTAAALRATGDARPRVRLGYDATLFPGPAVNPHWRPDYITGGVAAPTSALWVDEGRVAGGYGRVADPPAVAAQAFATALRRAGVRVVGAPRARPAPTDAPALAEVHSAPLREIAAHVLDVSDNDAAEVLARHVGIAAGRTGSIEDAQTAIATTLAGLGVPLDGARLYDGSGLSRDNRLTSAALLAVLQAAASPEHPDLTAVLTGLPVAGFTGSLQWRFAEGPPAGRGLVRAKTGTLTGVHALAGVATDRNGTDFAFLLVADAVAADRALAAREALDRGAAALAACRCSR